MGDELPVPDEVKMTIGELEERIPPDEALDPVPTREDEFVPYGALEDWVTTLVTTTEEVRIVIPAELLEIAPVPDGPVKADPTEEVELG